MGDATKPVARAGVPISPKQITYLCRLQVRHSLSDADLEALSGGVRLPDLGRAEASRLIGMLEQEGPAVERAVLKAKGQVDMFAPGEVDDDRGPPVRTRLAGVVWPSTG